MVAATVMARAGQRPHKTRTQGEDSVEEE